MFNDLTLEEVFEAYYECCKTKRCSTGALSFECDYENNLIKLYEELKTGTWNPGRSTCFIITKPVRREVFAAPFRDRIVHHILIKRMNPTFEKYFINDSYACRESKGTHAAIRRLEHFIRSETVNGKEKAWILKLDIKGFFMSIDRSMLYKRLCSFMNEKYRKGEDINFEKELCRKIIFNNPCNNCIRKSSLSAWEPLPLDKSLFSSKDGCGLPIGNLTSQVFANFYLSALDHFVKHMLKIKSYLRYVDDFVFVHKSKNFLKQLIPIIRDFLKRELKVKLHPKKIYLQPAGNGVPFLGAFIKLRYTLVSHRVKNNFVHKLMFFNQLCEPQEPSRSEKIQLRQSVNSYLGIMRHYSSYKFRKKALELFFRPYICRWTSVKNSCLSVSI